MVNKSLSRTVRDAFLAVHGGRLRPIQESALALIGSDQDALIVAGTSGGKTEAALMPIAEDLVGDSGTLRTVIVSPTRTLASDLHARMSGPFQKLGLRLDVETSDRRSTSRNVIPDLLIKTPEGLDSMLSKRREDFASLRHVVLDEIHLYLESARGTQVAGLLARMSHLSPPVRRIGLSATLPEPSRPAKMRLLRNPLYIRNEGFGPIREVLFFDWLGDADVSARRFVDFLAQLQIRKSLGFVKKKARAEELTHILDRGFLKGKCVPHHASLSPALRRQVEEMMRARPVSMVVATTTLEVGIDVGDIDACILFDVPPNKESYDQRAGRAGRRSGLQRVICVAGLYDKRSDFARVAGKVSSDKSSMPFLSGFIQQILSYLSTRDGALIEHVCYFCNTAFGVELDNTRLILSLLERDGFLLRDDESVEVSRKVTDLGFQLYLTFSPSSGSTVRDKHTGRTLGRADIVYGNEILLGGKAHRVTHIDPNDGALIVQPSESGVAGFAAPNRSLFDALAAEYYPKVRLAFRVD